MITAYASSYDGIAYGTTWRGGSLSRVRKRWIAARVSGKLRSVPASEIDMSPPVSARFAPAKMANGPLAGKRSGSRRCRTIVFCPLNSHPVTSVISDHGIVKSDQGVQQMPDGPTRSCSPVSSSFLTAMTPHSPKKMTPNQPIATIRAAGYRREPGGAPKTPAIHNPVPTNAAAARMSSVTRQRDVYATKSGIAAAYGFFGSGCPQLA